MLTEVFIACTVILGLFAVIAPKYVNQEVILAVLVTVYLLRLFRGKRKGGTIQMKLIQTSKFQENIDILEFSSTGVPRLEWYEGFMIGWPRISCDQWELFTPLCLNGSYLVANKFDEHSMVSRKLKSLAKGQEMCIKVVPLFNELDVKLSGTLIILAVDAEIFNFLQLIFKSCDMKSVKQVRLVLGCLRPGEALFKPVFDDLSNSSPKFTTVYVYERMKGTGNSNAGQLYRFGNLQSHGLQEQDLLGLTLGEDSEITVVTTEHCSMLTSSLKDCLKGAKFLSAGSFRGHRSSD